MKRLTLDLDDKLHAQFKSKAAAESLQMKEVLTWAVEDYLSGRYKPAKKAKAKA